jgi:hypothetical protein
VQLCVDPDKDSARIVSGILKEVVQCETDVHACMCRRCRNLEHNGEENRREAPPGATVATTIFFALLINLEFRPAASPQSRCAEILDGALYSVASAIGPRRIDRIVVPRLR